MSGLYLHIFNLIYIVMLIIIYFSKKRLKSFENNLFISLLILNAVGLLLHISSIFTIQNMELFPLINKIVTKAYIVYLLVWITVFTIYVYTISFKRDSIYGKILKIITFTTFSIFLVLSIVLPLYSYYDGNNMYTYGPVVNGLYINAMVYITVWVVCLLFNKKNIKNKKYAPLILMIIGGGIVMFVQYSHPEILLMTSLETLIVLLMYFTIENPDIHMIEQLNEAKQQAEKANHAKSDFLSSMSHEIRTPLNAIVGFSQALSEEDIPASAKEEVNDIISASESLLDIVNGILDISKIEANKLEIIEKEYSFKKKFDELVSLTKARMGDKPLDFRYQYDESIPDVLYGDDVRVKQVILNLLTNSVKYTKKGYVDFKINSIIKNDICRIIISVEDSGIGIKKENIEKLFTKFERFDEKNTTIEGTGLGLAITKKLIHLMNGQIVVQSVYGKGSRFTVAIDQKIVKDKTLEDIQGKVTEDFIDIDITGKKILVVDDNKLNLKVATRLLLTYKAEIITIDNGFECIDRINNGETFDLILMDDMMPKMSGVETLHKLKENDNYNIPTIALTANAIEGMRDKYISEGFDDYLSKPIDKLELNKIINKFLNQK